MTAQQHAGGDPTFLTAIPLGSISQLFLLRIKSEARFCDPLCVSYIH